MKFWSFDWFSWLIAFWVSFSFIFVLFVSSWAFSGSVGGGFVTPYVCFDEVSVYLLVLTVVISVCVLVVSPWLGGEVLFLVFLSQVFSMLSYVCCHVFFFWVFYELSIVSLLYLLVKYSPYSERYVAFWYFLGYVVFCSLPMLLVFLYYSLVFGSFSVLSWDVDVVGGDWWPLFLVSLLFVTKVPLFPFHSWLPIVHAEASSVVSMCLSGYIMKLGVLGVYRFGHWVIPYYLFEECYVICILFVSFFIFLCASFELDGKRWLAFLSLSHISLVPACLYLSVEGGQGVSFVYCLGHGLSSCMTFILFWFLCVVSGSRNWVMLKGVMVGSFFWEFVCVLCFCLCGSFPPCLQFFCELFVISSSGVIGGLVFYLLCVYLFFSSLVALVSLGWLLVRCYSIRFCGGVSFGVLLVFMFLGALSFSCFLVV